MVYAIRIEQIERVALAALAAGAEINPDDHRAEYDSWLHSELEIVDADIADLNRALGVGRWRR